MRFGEKLAATGPDGYYSMTPAQWLDWCESRVTQSSSGSSGDVIEFVRRMRASAEQGELYGFATDCTRLLAMLTLSASGTVGRVTCICGVSFSAADAEMVKFHGDCHKARFIHSTESRNDR